MNREIKFRVWEIKEKRFAPYYSIAEDFVHVAEGDQYYLVNNLNATDEHKAYLIEKGIEIRDEFILSQFTGEKDRNNKEIFEGDIVKRRKLNYEYDEWDAPNEPRYKEETSNIEYRGHGFWVANESFGYEGEDLWSWAEMEVIGNIYESPELLVTLL